MPNVFIVTLDNDNHCLNIADETLEPEILKSNSDWQTIRWKLQVKDPNANASFNLQTDPEPGFAWVGMTRPAGVFSAPVLRKQRKELTIADLNDNKHPDDSENTTGEWIYQLSATINNVTYQTKTKTDTGKKMKMNATTNPRIKNT